MTIVLALAAALAYGAADFCGGLAARRSAALAVVVWSQATGLLLALAALPLVASAPRPSDLAWGAACGLGGAGAIGLLYRGLAIGTMGVVSPITAVLAAVIPVAWALARGERPASLAVLGIACALVAVVLVSAAPGPARLRGIPEAIGAGVAFGFFFIALAQTHADSGLYPLLTARAASVTLLLLTALALRRPLAVRAPAARVIVAAGVLDMLANALYLVAVQRGSLSIVAVLTSLYPASTVALAALVLRERLSALQWSGVALAFAGVVCIALGRQ